jgi:hypothetical protein
MLVDRWRSFSGMSPGLPVLTLGFVEQRQIVEAGGHVGRRGCSGPAHRGGATALKRCREAHERPRGGAPERSRLSRKYQPRPFGGDDGPGLMLGLFRHRRHTVVFETS